MRLLLDEMYSAVHADALRGAGIEAVTLAELGLAGSSDPDVLAAAIAEDCALLTENVADFSRISAEHLLAGRHHPGVLIALSSRFSRRRAGGPALVAGVAALVEEPLGDRVVYLRGARGRPRARPRPAPTHTIRRRCRCRRPRCRTSIRRLALNGHARC